MSPDLFTPEINRAWWAAYRECKQIGIGDAYCAVAGETARQAMERGKHGENEAIKTGVIHAFNSWKGGAYPFPVVVNGDGPRAA